MLPKFVLKNEEEKVIQVHLELTDDFLEIATDDGYYLVSINLKNGGVIVNENSRFGLKYTQSVK